MLYAYHKRMKINIIISINLIWINSFSISQGQIRSDFLLGDEGLQSYIQIDKNGNIHATWNYFNGIYYTILDSLGDTFTPTIQISGDYFSSRIDVNQKHVILVWKDRTIFEQDYIIGKLFSLTGQSLSNSIRFNDFGSSPDACFLNDSIFIVIWQGNGLTSTEIYGQIINNSLQFIGDNELLSDHGNLNVNYGNPLVLSQPQDNNFIVVWRDDHLGSNKVYVRFFDYSGSPIDSSYIISEDLTMDDVWYLSADTNTNGDIAVVWGGKLDNAWQIQWRWLRKDGTPICPSKQITTITDSISSYPCVDISIDLNGNCVVVWEQEEKGYSKIYAQRFLPDRSPLGKKIKISVDEDTLNQYFPSVELYHNRIFTSWSNSHDINIEANIIDFNNPTTQVISRRNSLSQNILIYQNYPNPFNTSTTISYALVEESEVKISIFNIHGVEVVRLLEKKQNSGHYTINWNVNNLPSSIYYCRIKTENYLVSQKLLFLK